MKSISIVMALVAVLALGQSARADGPFFSPKVYGYVALGASGWMFAEAIKARQDADEAYDRYRRASTSGDAQTFYDESRRFDTRTVVMGAMGAGALAWSLKLLREKKESEDLPLPSLEVKGVGVEVQTDVFAKGVHLKLSKGF